MARLSNLGLTASGLALCVVLSGCGALGLSGRPSAAGQQVSNAPGVSRSGADAVRAALAKKDGVRALALAEKLVALSPRDADARALLGQVYLTDGRFESARSALRDAMSLGAVDRRTIITLALTESALGQSAAARAILTDHASGLSGADLGLALALAGDPVQGANILVRAAQDTGGDARIRQNLAYALALAGDWTQARLVASRDLSAAEVQDQIGRWAILARPGNEALRVAALLGVDPRADDAGMPLQLALNDSLPANAASAPVSVAAISPKLQVDDKVLARPMAAPLFVSPLKRPGPVSISTAQPMRLQVTPVAATRPVLSLGTKSGKLPASASAAFVRTTPMSRTAFINQAVPGKGTAAASRFVTAARPAPAVPRTAQGNWAVQLGAFTDVAGAMGRWQQFANKDSTLARLPVISSPIDTNGATLTRLSIKGFASRDAAMGLCTRLRTAGQPCFPRQGD